MTMLNSPDAAVLRSSMFETITHNVGCWAASALVNGDVSGLNDEDSEVLHAWFASATRDWVDTDGNHWVYTHLSINTDERDEFAYDDVSGYYCDVYPTTLYFAKGVAYV